MSCLGKTTTTKETEERIKDIGFGLVLVLFRTVEEEEEEIDINNIRVDYYLTRSDILEMCTLPGLELSID